MLVELDGDVLNPLVLQRFWLDLITSRFLRAVSGGSPNILALALEHEQRAAVAWASMRPEVDTDGDGDQDGPAVATGASAGSVP